MSDEVKWVLTLEDGVQAPIVLKRTKNKTALMMHVGYLEPEGDFKLNISPIREEVKESDE